MNLGDKEESKAIDINKTPFDLSHIKGQAEMFLISDTNRYNIRS